MFRPERGASARARAADGGPGAGAAPVLPDLGAFEAYAASARAELAGEWRPFLFRLAPGEHPRFEAICAQRGLRVHDRIEAQVRELATVRSPAADRRDHPAWAAAAIARAGHPCAVGAWAYFPWTDTVVHVLDREDFFAVITDRNRDKLTREEQRLLRGKRIGVMGLSVGGEAAVTLAQEHLCGRIVLADFDALDLSNLNRLGAGVDALGVNKAVIVARRIALIDPWLDVTVMRDGVTADNVEAFLDGLDLLVEECDGLAMKYDVRRLARQRRLDIVFAGDERGFLSVEPYRSRPDLEPFHGRIAERPLPREAYAGDAEFMRALTEWLGGWDALSERSRASLERLGESISGYPQLAGEARYAAGLIAHVARRLLLGEDVQPFLGWLDPEQAIG